jgi:beta-N-acetylhexosaminidase
MFYELNEKQQSWADAVFDTLTMEEKVAQLLHPNYSGQSDNDLQELFQKIPVGSFFTGTQEFEVLRKRHEIIQKNSKIPVLISADMENGTNMIKDKSIVFPTQMGLGACGKAEYAYMMGKITARLSRSAGVHWTFSPVADLNLNPQNPITNSRSLGDKKSAVIPLLKEIIRGLQEEGLMAATCKHFPGDGVDDRDQHMLVSVNSLPMDQWEKLYGAVWKSVIAGGTKAIMSGHISFPDYQGMQHDPDDALPATLCKKLQIDLLRNQLGFNGVIVSDAFPMIGFTCRYPGEELAWRNIAAGSDSVLFCDPVLDYQRLLEALKKGLISEEQVENSARRIIELKASLNLFEDCFAPEMSEQEFEEGRAFAQNVADSAAVVLRQSSCGDQTLVPGKDKKVLTVTLERVGTIPFLGELPVVDEELKKRGFEVDHLYNPDASKLREALTVYDRIFVNFNIFSHAGLGLRLVGKPAMAFWRCFLPENPSKVVFTSFGSPYVLYDHPYLHNLSCVWGRSDACQRTAVKMWCGELVPQGTLPVRLKTTQVQALDLPEEYYS